jgi:subtilisin
MTSRWMSWRAALVAVLLMMVIPSFSAVSPASANSQTIRRLEMPLHSAQTDVIENSYIVVYRDDVIGAASVTDSIKKSGTVKVKHEYKSALRGFSGEMSEAEAEKLAKDPRVAFVEPNRTFYKVGASLDYGPDRVNADLNSYANINNFADTNVNVDIAIVDDGAGPHPLLNIAGGYDCTGSGSYNGSSLNSHGTFVAGLAAAIDNSEGLPGVAPGARIWAIKVIHGSSGDTAALLCGLDWVYDHRSTIEVANLSLGSYFPYADTGCNSETIHYAICRVTNGGVTVVVAAGNDAMDASNFLPAKYPEVITVSALADSDGSPGGFGPPISVDGELLGKDDNLATFSNYGSVVDIAAPGVELISLYPGGGYSIGSGTSFSSPITAGAAALYIAEHGDVGPSAVKSGLLSSRERYDMPADRDSFEEGIVNASGRGFPSISLSRISAQVDHMVTVTVGNFEPNEAIQVRFDSTLLTQFIVNAGGDGSATFKVPAGVKGSHKISARSHSFMVTTTLTISPRIRLSKTSGVPGSSFDVSLRGFEKQQTVAIKWYNGSSYVTLGTMTTSNTGSANKIFYVPNTYRGGHKVEADPPTGGSVSSTFAVKPLVKITPGSGASGSNATIELKGFVKSETVKVYFFNGPTKILLRTKTVSSTTGYASSTVTIPAGATIGVHSIQAEGTGGSLATTSFNVTSIGGSAGTPTPTATLSPTETATPSVTETSTAPPVEETPTALPTDTPTEAPTEGPTETATPEPTETGIVEDAGTPGP